MSFPPYGSDPRVIDSSGIGNLSEKLEGLRIPNAFGTMTESDPDLLEAENSG
jgi:hypothetical protein